MKVAINARILDTDFLRGWSRYTVHLIDELQKLGVDIVLLSDRPIQKKWINEKKTKVIVTKCFNYLYWEQVVLPRLCHQEQVDILHCPINFGLPLFASVPRILTLHDAIDKSFYDSKKTFMQRYNLVSLKVKLYQKISRSSANQIITVSHYAKKDLIESYKIPSDKIIVIYESAGDHFNTNNVKPLSEIKKKYVNFKEDAFFYIGGMEVRKNIEGLFAAYRLSQQEKPLVLAGGTEQEREYFSSKAKDLQISKNVHILSSIDESDLPSLYFYSYCFMYPSFSEGFGLQAVEAMKMGKPVLASGNTSLREVVGIEDALFDPYNINQMCEKMNWILNKDNYLKLVNWSKKQHMNFSWSECAKKTMEVYKKALDAR